MWRTSYGTGATCSARDIPFSLEEFTDRYSGRYRDMQLPPPLRLI